MVSSRFNFMRSAVSVFLLTGSVLDGSDSTGDGVFWHPKKQPNITMLAPINRCIGDTRAHPCRLFIPSVQCRPMSDEAKTYEEILTALESEVKRLEQGDLPLEEALLAFEKGMALAQQGTETLNAAEKKVEVLTRARDGVAETRPLDDEG